MKVELTEKDINIEVGDIINYVDGDEDIVCMVCHDDNSLLNDYYIYMLVSIETGKIVNSCHTLAAISESGYTTLLAKSNQVKLVRSV